MYVFQGGVFIKHRFLYGGFAVEGTVMLGYMKPPKYMV